MDLFNQEPSPFPTLKPVKRQSFNTNTTNNEVWLTPPELIKSLGIFDLDPCSPIVRPWDTAKLHYNKIDNGLLLPWNGRVWLNPPYGDQLIKWLHKMSLHLNGTALIFGRTDTQAFHKFIFPFAESIFFIKGRIRFHLEDGTPGRDRGNAPSVLVSYKEYDAEMIDQSGIKGHHLYLKPKLFVAGITYDSKKTWRIIVGEALEELNCEASLQDIYEAVVRMAPDKIQGNAHFKAKIRQTLQFHFEKIKTATYSIN